MRPLAIPLLAVSLLPGFDLSAQQQGMQGSYRVDQAAEPGPRRFAKLSDAIDRLTKRGMSGPVVIVCAPGTHQAGIEIDDIDGLGEKRRLVFRGAPLHELRRSLPGARLDLEKPPVTWTASGAPLITFGSAASYVQLSGLHFAGDEAHGAVHGLAKSAHIEISDCVFGPGLGASGPKRSFIEVEGGSRNTAWHIHHNNFHCKNTNKAGHFSRIGRFDIHDNLFQLENVENALYFINKNDAYNRIHRNVFLGSVRTAIHVAASNMGNRILQNLILTDAGSGGFAIECFGSSSHHSYIYGNVLAPKEGGGLNFSHPTLLHMEGDGNVYVSSSDHIATVRGQAVGRHDSLKSWQKGSEELPKGAMDTKSQQLTRKGQQQNPLLMRVLRSGKVADKQELSQVLALLGNPDPAVQRLAIAAANRLGRQAHRAVPLLVGLCRHPDLYLRADAIEALGRIRISAEIAVPDLVRQLDTKHPLVVQAAARALANLRPMSQMAVPKLQALLKKSDEDHGTTHAILRRSLATIAPKPKAPGKPETPGRGR